MKRIWPALICFFIAISLCVFEITYTTSGARELHGIVAKAKEEFDGGRGDVNRVNKTLALAKDSWDSKENIMDIFLHHDRIDDIGVKIDSARSLVSRGDDSADTEMLEVLSMLSTIEKIEFPTIENIF